MEELGIGNLFARRSIRRYTDEAVDSRHIDTLLRAAMAAPSANNRQPWRFVVITGKGQIQQLGRMVSPNGAFMVDAAAAIAVLSLDTKYYLEDCSAATQNLLLAASALGIGACWIAGDKKDYAPEVSAFIGAAEGERLVSIVAMGYPVNPVTPKPKKPLAELIRWLR